MLYQPQGCSNARGGRYVKPAHVAIIMDGNGRWAEARGLPRRAGHRAGVEALRKAVRSAGELGINWLTVYAFSSENWSRPRSEVNDLMGLLRLFIRRDLAELHQNGVRVRIIGDRENLEKDIKSLLLEAENLTAENTSMNLVIAFNYGARDEIVRAAKSLFADVQAGKITADDIDIDGFGNRLDTAGIPDPDLIIRTSGEQRLSNFLLWQAAYAEFVFLPCHWPDFGRCELETALATFNARERRFGGVGAREAAL
ncbi:isoprenyl transferase [Nitratireductor aquimarinus]|uniref:isoprenyl transferase n=1 Tax=Alphaproteobacteria TaxID=28211 RepID=UPI000DDD0259|nr:MULTISPECIES: isoprenyl transferase [Alphaproteobacteria]MBN7760054.1 isoprenyl transferase [Nitratireductor aquibiodomus]MBN7776846.1 isoprenyl transferase [Nitratireductor pacificus]MBY6021233.1 isoprenyl transferase [Nitratireductor sp. DP7N14-4]MBN7756447.1 isoprenyl transferase [Nitratireductor aquimarinus]MBN7780180.1 isoprenyl transferase [Nitratireductor pacificus]